ncbi:peptide chain release factor N(5)-glutamine methyltransferase [Mucilaginibacter sp. Bleaf8]|uniref:peptide chain release factor N(5)-glutamine methyltransferase n=1 Tax=Mucilaginibacter sp. Bleaf8 TaxID=2834430 RepID=UPI001BCAA743|nr:peptide chain release factor N(5)-glutamine methyltransferase [Mucilaginibacter sp. Bleaf8]MBS7563130.1 peptide chain release factor N(5)-glutamine methyltransferase [Mucilaginibacter sp. Bleaf8]
MKTVKEVYDSYRQDLQALYDSNEITALTELVLSELTGFSRAKLKAFPEVDLAGDQQTSVTHILSELKTGKPIQYILGFTEFYGLKFSVNPSVLIPRPETEELVDWIVNTIPNTSLTDTKILDVGTGSGCIAISLAKTINGSIVTAMDISVTALQTARENAIANGANVTFIEADVLNEQTINMIEPNQSVIVSNPPYVTPLDKEHMHTNVTDFEPHTALFVPQEDPLLFYNTIADLAIARLSKSGLLFFEINEAYGQATVEMLSGKGFTDIELRKDMFGKDRMIKALWP